MADTAETKPKGSAKRYIVLVVVIVLGTLVLKLAAFLFFFGMLPAIIAYEVDHSKRKFIFSTVAAFNLAGVFPDMAQLALLGGTFEAVTAKLLDPGVWLTMYGAAALGWLVVWLSPIVAGTTLDGIYSGRELHLEMLQKKAVEEWGDEVKGDEPDEGQ